MPVSGSTATFKAPFPSAEGKLRVGVDPIPRIFRVENHDEAYRLWQSAGEKRRLLLHVDAHHDMWRLKGRQCLSIANFICPALEDDIVREVFWVVPGLSWQSGRNRRHLLRHARKIAKDYPGAARSLRIGRDRISARLFGKPLTICSLDSLPELDESVLLDIDTDFYLIPRVTYGEMDQHSPLPWCWPEELLEGLRAHQVRADIVTIAYSVEGGYTPLLWKYLGDETALRLQQPNSGSQALEGMTCMRQAAEAAERGQLAAAEGIYERARRLLPDSGAPLCHLAHLNLRMRRDTDARRCYRQALDLDATYRTAFNSVALWRYEDRRYGGADEEWRRTLALDQADAYAHLGLGWLAQRRKSWQEAEMWFRKAVSLNDCLVDGWRGLGDVLAKQQRESDAIEAYQASLRLALAGHKPLRAPIATLPEPHRLVDPNHCEVFGQLGRLYEIRGEIAEAIKRYRISAAGVGAGPGVHWRLVRLYAESRQVNSALLQAACAVKASFFAVRDAMSSSLHRLRRSSEHIYDRFLSDESGPGKTVAEDARTRVTESWRKFRRLTWRERRALIRSLVLLPLIALALRVLGFRRSQMTLGKLTPEREPALDGRSDSAMREAQLAARMVATASRDGLVHGNCLEQSLTLWWLLRRRRIPAQLRIGIRKQANKFQAHAWVELAGAVLNDRQDVHREYTAFAGDIAALEAGAP